MSHYLLAVLSLLLPPKSVFRPPSPQFCSYFPGTCICNYLSFFFSSPFFTPVWILTNPIKLLLIEHVRISPGVLTMIVSFVHRSSRTMYLKNTFYTNCKEWFILFFKSKTPLYMKYLFFFFYVKLVEALASHIFKLYIINHWSSVRAFEPRLPRLMVKMLSTPEHVCVWGISSFSSMEELFQWQFLFGFPVWRINKVLGSLEQSHCIFM